MAEWSFYVRVVGEVAVDSGDGLTFGLHGKDAQASPAPVVYSNGILQAASTYTFNDGDQSTAASVTFNASQSGNTIRVNYRWKYECTDSALGEDFDASVWDVGKGINKAVGVDVNGRTITASSYDPVQAWAGLVTWEYVTKAFWREWQRIADNDYAFDIEETSDSGEPGSINNLRIQYEYPRYAKIPGVPDLVHVGVKFIGQSAI